MTNVLPLSHGTNRIRLMQCQPIEDIFRHTENGNDGEPVSGSGVIDAVNHDVMNVVIVLDCDVKNCTTWFLHVDQTRPVSRLHSLYDTRLSSLFINPLTTMPDISSK